MSKFQDYNPKVEYPEPDFLKNTGIIRNLIFVIHQVTIMQVLFNEKIPVCEKRDIEYPLFHGFVFNKIGLLSLLRFQIKFSIKRAASNAPP